MRQNQQTILVVEDHDSLRELIGIVLGKNFNVISAKDGLDAWAVLSQGLVPDLILLDLDMPTMDGQSFLLHLRSSGMFSHLPVMILSGSTEQAQLGANLVEQFQVAGFVEKPFNPVQLNSQINTAIAGSLVYAN